MSDYNQAKERAEGLREEAAMEDKFKKGCEAIDGEVSETSAYIQCEMSDDFRLSMRKDMPGNSATVWVNQAVEQPVSTVKKPYGFVEMDKLDRINIFEGRKSIALISKDNDKIRLNKESFETVI